MPSDISVRCRFSVVSLTVTIVVVCGIFRSARSSATMTFVNGIWVPFLPLAFQLLLCLFRKQLLHFLQKCFVRSNEKFAARKVFLVVVPTLIEFIDAICIERNAESKNVSQLSERGRMYREREGRSGFVYLSFTSCQL